MSPSHGEIVHVSDTALMVAACRAIETESPDGFVHDPFAARLAGSRGMAIYHTITRPEILRFGIAVRSRFLDELIAEALSTGSVSTVLSLGCGLDTRPWRLALPPDLRWIEVDFAGMLDYKDSVMSAEAPRCRRDRLTADLNDAAQRRAVLEAAGRAPVLVITEGLLMYLPAGTIDALAAEAHHQSGITHWLTDITTAAFAKAIGLDSMRSVRHVQAPDSLTGDQIMEILGRHGWTTTAHRSYLTDIGFAVQRIRKMMGDRPAGPPPVAPDDPTGVHCFSRAW